MIDKLLAFVKDQAAYHQRQADKFEGRSDFRHDKHSTTAKRFQELQEFLEDLPNNINAATPHSTNQSDALLPSELVGLPEELINELSITDSDKEAFEIIEIIDEAGGTLTLDRIIIAIYRKTDEVPNRGKVNAKINRIMRKGVLWAVPKRKGLYTTIEPDTEEDGSDLV